MNMHRVWFRIDWHLVAPILVLLSISLTVLFSINVSFFRAQLLSVIIGGVIFFIFSYMNARMIALYSVPIYVVSLIVFVFVLLVGFESRGSVRWLSFLGFQIQFSEIFKPFLALSLATFLTNASQRSLKSFLMVFVFLAPVAFLIYKQPDLGSASIYILSTLLVLVFYGYPLKWFGIGLVPIAAAIPLLWRFLHEYQKERVLTFLHISNDPLGTSYNAIQSIIAIGSGSFFGKGLGQGTQSTLRFLPERQTDFIFAALSEELGFIGSVIVIAAFCYLLYRLYILSQEMEDTFAKTFILCTFSLILVQFFVNIGMNMGLLPIVGVALPFVSYGGSSLVSNAILLGLASSLAKFVSHKNVLEIA